MNILFTTSGPSELTLRRNNRIAAAGFGVFWMFGAMMAALAGTTLMWQNSLLARALRSTQMPTAYLPPIGRIAGSLFLLLSALLVVTRREKKLERRETKRIRALRPVEGFSFFAMGIRIKSSLRMRPNRAHSQEVAYQEEMAASTGLHQREG
jgi:hypothetical protein